MIWFRDIKTRIELKSKFRELAKVHHPDHGGDTRAMQEIVAEYERLYKILPQGKPCKTKTASRPRATVHIADKAYYPAHIKKPIYTHKEICSFTKTLYIYGRLSKVCPIRGLHRLLCQRIDPNQTKPYCDYGFNFKVAKASLKALHKTLLRVFHIEFYRLLKFCEANLESQMKSA